MIPAVDEVLRGWMFVARRIGVEPIASVRVVEAALEHARSLSESPTDDPAALFYAFACRPRALVGGARVMPALMAMKHARRLGCELTIVASELDALRKRLLAADRLRSTRCAHGSPRGSCAVGRGRWTA